MYTYADVILSHDTHATYFDSIAHVYRIGDKSMLSMLPDPSSPNGSGLRD